MHTTFSGSNPCNKILTTGVNLFEQEYLRKKYHNAAGFTLKTELYASTWGANETSPYNVTIGRYTVRTTHMRDRVKNVVITARVKIGRMSTHGYWAAKGYKKYVLR